MAEGIHKSENRQWVFDQLGLPNVSETKLIVSVGMLERRKRHKLLLKRIAPVLNEKLILIIIGNGGKLNQLKRLVQRREIDKFVVFLPHTPLVAKYLAGADLVVHTSALEGLSQVLLQALICKTPVIATKNVGAVELTDLHVIGTSGHQIANKVLEVLNLTSHDFTFDYSLWTKQESGRIYLEMLNYCKEIQNYKATWRN
jgi:glycosyltransferase involved in cell wall biosynthesis